MRDHHIKYINHTNFLVSSDYWSFHNESGEGCEDQKLLTLEFPELSRVSIILMHVHAILQPHLSKTLLGHGQTEICTYCIVSLPSLTFNMLYIILLHIIPFIESVTTASPPQKKTATIGGPHHGHQKHHSRLWIFTSHRMNHQFL